MQDHIPDALIAAFERQYDASWNDPQLRNERLAMRYGWAAAIEQKQCLFQIQEPVANQQLTAVPMTAMTNALREAEAALEVALARILKVDPGHSISVTSEAKALVAVRQALSAQTAPVAVGEREAFEQWISKDGGDLSTFGSRQNTHYKNSAVNYAWSGWQARASLAATPADHSGDATEMVQETAPVVLPEHDAWREGAKFALKAVSEVDSLCWLTDSMKEVCIKQAADAVIAERDRQRSVLVGVSAPAAQAAEVLGWVHKGKSGKIGNHFYTYEPHCDTSVRDDGGEKIAVIAATSPQAQADARDADGLYYLQDARWSAMVGNCPSWWLPDGNGYTTNLDEAARFTFAEAMAQHRCRDTDLPWLCSEVDKLRRPTVDCQYMPRSWGEQRVQIHAQAAAKEGVQQG